MKWRLGVLLCLVVCSPTVGHALGGEDASPAAPQISGQPVGQTADKSTSNCVDLSLLTPGADAVYLVRMKDYLYEMVQSFFEDSPCEKGKPRVTLAKAASLVPPWRMEVMVDGISHLLTATNGYGLIAAAVLAVGNALSEDKATCERAKKLVEVSPLDAVPMLLRACPREEADKFAMDNWRMYAEDISLQGSTQVAVLLLEHLGLQKKAAELRESPLYRGDRAAAPSEADGPVKVDVGYLRINSRPWAAVWIDGRDTGLVTPIARYKLSAGRHSVTLKNARFRCEGTYDVVIAPGETASLVKQMDCSQSQ